MPKRPKYTAAQVAAALHATRGLVLHAARVLNCDSQTVWNYVHRHPSVAAALHDARGALVDLAECQLEQALLRSEWAAIQFTLSRLGKSRGWGDSTRHELGGGDGAPVTFTIQLTHPQDAL